MEAMRRSKRFGRPRKFSERQCEELIVDLKAGALATGFATDLWTSPRIATIYYQDRILRVTRECKDECVPDPTELHCVEPTDTTV
jgi:hypothetical protein